VGLGKKSGKAHLGRENRRGLETTGESRKKRSGEEKDPLLGRGEKGDSGGEFGKRAERNVGKG